MEVISRSLRPLVFLTIRTIVNGVRRAFSSPQRTIGVLVFAIYWGRMVLAPLFGSRPSRVAMFGQGPRLTLPPIESIDAVVFVVFALFSAMFMVGVMSYRGNFRPADVDVLFPTPVDTRVVLVFRLLRDYALTLMMALIMVLIGGSNSSELWKNIFANFPREGAIVGRAAVVAWLLMSFAWVCLGYGVSMFVNRSDLASDRNKKVISYIIGSIIVLILAHVSIRLKMDFSWLSARDVANSLILRLLLAPASAATAMVVGPLENNLTIMFIGAAGLIAIAVLGIFLAVTQVSYMYDQAAAKGFGSLELKSLQKSGDAYGVVAEQARRGKFKASRFTLWWGSLRFVGGPALMWKEMLLTFRGGAWQFIIFVPLILFFSWMPLWASAPPRSGMGSVYLGMQMLGAFIMGFGGSQMAFIEMLRRVDLQKPLPFSPTVTLFWETAARVVPSIVATLIAAVGAVILAPEIWPFVLSSIPAIPSFTLVITAVTLMLTVLFPDYEDPTQRGFRGLMQMLGVVLALLPATGLSIGLLYLKVNPIIIAVPAVGINIGLTVLLCTIAGNLYANFNPSE